MVARIGAALSVVMALATGLAAQSTGRWSAQANQTTSSVHSGAQGGPHEHVEVENRWVEGQLNGVAVTMTIVHFVKRSNGEVVEETATISIPYKEKRSLHGDVKSVTVTAGANAAQGTYAVTYP